MNALDDIIIKMYSSDDFSYKGKVLELKEPFFLVYNGNPYIAFITEHGKLNGSSTKYGYSLFSVKEKKEVPYDSHLFSEISTSLPSLDNLSAVGAKFNPALKKQLDSEQKEFASVFSENGCFTAQEKQKYLSYLSEMKQLKSNSYEKLLDYFISIWR